MTPQQLSAGHERAWKKVYRYNAIARRLWKARAFEPLGLAANLGYRFYAHHLQRFYNCDWHLSWSAAARRRPGFRGLAPAETRSGGSELPQSMAAASRRTPSCRCA